MINMIEPEKWGFDRVDLYVPDSCNLTVNKHVTLI